VNLTDIELDYSGKARFGFINYQIPVQALIYARLSKQVWMNASGGLGLNFFPSDAQAVNYVQELDVNFVQIGLRTGGIHWASASILANYGFEYRTKKDGIFYLGVSFDRPFGDILESSAILERADDSIQIAQNFYTGSYLTIDFRYFFHEDPERRRRKPTKKRK
jgi:hypothetical protein